MNYKLLIISALAAITLIFASCAKNEIIEPQPEARTVRVSATIPTTMETRTAFEGSWTATAGYGIKVKWAVGDKFSILCWQGEDIANWGNLISAKYNDGTVNGEEKGEILYTLQAADITDDGRTVNFNFNIPTQITDNTQPVKVLVTYLGKTYYSKAETNTEPFYHGKPWLNTYRAIIDNASDITNLLYVTRSTPMTLRGEIAAGWNAGTSQAVFDGQFKHLTALFAVQVRNNTGAAITPQYVSVKFNGGEVQNNGYNFWNPFTQDIISQDNQHGVLNIYNNTYHTIAAGQSFVYFIPVYIKTAPTEIKVVFNDKNGGYYYPETNFKTNAAITLQPGKCYTLNTVVHSITNTGGYGQNTDFQWDTAPATQAPWQ